ncbi:MAG: hypothetical protein IT381_12555 [Deltaproteobacteria bacterium]|nr:hypothetical protein [Deltaproteobacteria bacterium]
MNASPQKQRALDRLSKMSLREAEHLTFDVLRRWLDKAPDRRPFSVHGDFGLIAMGILFPEAVEEDRIAMKEVFLSGQTGPELRTIFETWWAFVRRGLLIPTQHFQGQWIYFTLTDAGARAVSNVDHPYSANALERLAARCPELPELVLTSIDDAILCAQHALYRASVTLVGLAYEATIEQVLEAFVAKGRAKLPFKAGDRVGELKRVLDAISSVHKDERRMLASAIDFGDHLRERRNEASHAKSELPFDSADEIDEWLAGALRHLPVLWSMRLLS